MIKIIYVEPNGNRRSVDAAPGTSAMEAGRANGVEGIIGECGGNCVCATCRVIVDSDWSVAVGAPSEVETDLLEAIDGLDHCARLSCQITLSEALDGLVLHVVEDQF